MFCQISEEADNYPASFCSVRSVTYATGTSNAEETKKKKKRKKLSFDSPNSDASHQQTSLGINVNALVGRVYSMTLETSFCYSSIFETGFQRSSWQAATSSFTC